MHRTSWSLSLSLPLSLFLPLAACVAADDVGAPALGADDQAIVDGLPALLEEALGMNPALPDAASEPPVVQEGGYLTMTVPKHAGVAYEVQTAGTLSSGQPDSFSATTTTILIDDATTLKVRDNVPLAGAPHRFMRLKVTAAP